MISRLEIDGLRTQDSTGSVGKLAQEIDSTRDLLLSKGMYDLCRLIRIPHEHSRRRPVTPSSIMSVQDMYQYVHAYIQTFINLRIASML